jgi:hypothetical protein
LFGSKKKLLEPRRATTQLSRAEVIAAVENVCEELNTELRRKASASWIGKKLGYSEAEAEQHHDRYLYDTSAAVIRVFLNSRSSASAPKWEAVIRTSAANGATTVEMQLVRLELDYKFTYADFSDALRAAL